MLQQSKQDRPSAAALRLDLTSAKVLIADDNPRALEILAQILLGFSVRHATQCRTIDEAALILDHQPHDLIIVDGEMPDRDGFDLIHHIRSNPEGPNFTTPTVLASGFTPLEKVVRARDIGANFVVTKPIVPGVLLSRIELLARRPRQFVCTATYCGPDRRFKNAAPPPGVEERRADAMKLIAQPDRAMSQDDVDSLFG